MSELQIETNRPLAPLTNMGVGGSAAYYALIHSVDQLKTAVIWARERERPFFLLGGGSNLVVGDEGIRGLVAHLDMRGREWSVQGDQVRLHVAAGEDWDDLVADTVARDWAGLECLSGIPGRVGAAPIQNIGAYGQELADCAEYVDVLDLQTLESRRMSADECTFAYRDSRFKREPGRFAVVAVGLRLTHQGAPTVRYADLERVLSGGSATLADVRETVLGIRRTKSMVIDPADPNAKSCGSFFTNPILDDAAYRAFQGRDPGDVKVWPQPGGGVKLSAAWLIEQSGFYKGYVKDGAGLSEKHCLALINRGEAKASEILALAKEIQAGVQQRFGVWLTPEPTILTEA